uniref:Uncharacterized protein n=1 Tax=Myotis myotis TaxID=51298 RepID=A0A7J7V3Y4_MYOMY|nr:hypothetical protein mMyoMyo1_008435 [Myotis myotis]
MLFLKNFTLFRLESKYPLLKTCTSHLCTHLIPVATVTDFPKRGRLRQHTLIAWQLQKSGIQNQFHWAQIKVSQGRFPSGGTNRDCFPASAVAVRGCLGALLPLQRTAFCPCCGPISRCLPLIRTLTSRACPDHPGQYKGKCKLKLRKTSLHSWCKKRETFPTATTLSLEYLSL